MTTLTVAPTPTVAAATRTAITAAGLAAAVASAASIASSVINSDASQAESAQAPVTIVGCLITGLAFAVIAMTLPGLSAATRLPRWSLTLAGLAAAFTVVSAWTFGTVLPHVAGHVSPAQFEELGHPDLLLMLFSLPMQALGLVGFIALAVSGWRRRAFSRGAAVVLILAGVAGALTGWWAVVGLLAGVAMAWAARTAKATQDN
jgi:hypothetical protein